MAIGEESDAAVISTANGTSNQVNDLYPSSSSVDESCGEAKRNLWGPRLFGKISESKELKESKESNVKECTVTSPVETVCKRQEVLCVENSNQDAQTPKEGLNPVSLEPTNAEESDSPIKSPSNSANVGSVMPHQDGSHPFPHDTGASGGNQISADCAANGNTPAKIKIIQSTDTPKTTKVISFHLPLPPCVSFMPHTLSTACSCGTIVRSNVISQLSVADTFIMMLCICRSYLHSSCIANNILIYCLL